MNRPAPAADPAADSSGLAPETALADANALLTNAENF